MIHNVRHGLRQVDGRAIRAPCGGARRMVGRLALKPGILNAECHDLGRDIGPGIRGGDSDRARVGHCDDRGTPNCTGGLARGATGRAHVANKTTITLQPYYNRPTTILQPSYNHPTTILQPSYNHPTTVLQPSYNHPTTILQPSYNHPTTILQSSYNSPTTVIQPSYNRPTATLQPSYTPSS